MRALLLSIKPQFVAKILNGDKTIEVRKSKPNVDLPIDVYIYCTKDKKYSNLINRGGFLTGMVVAKFTLNKVEKITPQIWTPKIEQEILDKSCLKENELFDYICKQNGEPDNPFFAWHISNLVIFDKPKELREFKANKKYWCDKCPYQYGICLPKCEELKPLTKAPQSWCYIETEDEL